MSVNVSAPVIFASLAAVLATMAAPSEATGRSESPKTRSEGAIPGGTRYGTTQVDGLNIFYREAGSPGAPVVLLLHGFPASSFMYRELIERLSDRYHVIAPDYPGFGYSDAPSPHEFAYTFDHLADVIEKLTEQLGLKRYSLYMQDFGGPVGFRLAVRHPERVASLVIQNANAYEEGLPESFWAKPRQLWKDPSEENFQKIREAAMSDASLEWNYTHGVKDPKRVSPDSWILQRALLNRPGNKDIQLDLFHDYGSNVPLYPQFQAFFRERKPPTLIVWGKNDKIFPADGAGPYLRDLPNAELHLLDTGHFALEDKLDVMAPLIHNFLDRNRAPS